MSTITKPKDLLDKVRKILQENSHDPETCHDKLDRACLSVLEELGYGKSVELIKTSTRWYG